MCVYLCFISQKNDISNSHNTCCRYHFDLLSHVIWVWHKMVSWHLKINNDNIMVDLLFGNQATASYAYLLLNLLCWPYRNCIKNYIFSFVSQKDSVSLSTRRQCCWCWGWKSPSRGNDLWTAGTAAGGGSPRGIWPNRIMGILRGKPGGEWEGIPIRIQWTTRRECKTMFLTFCFISQEPWVSYDHVAGTIMILYS